MQLALPTRKLLGLLCVLVFTFNTAKAGIEPIPTGSFIINMGVSPQTYLNGIKPWGMVYDLIKNHKVQVRWVISQTKAKDGKDFTYEGVDYKGGTLIIPKKYRSAAVNARITYWQSLGVIGTTTTSDFNVDVTHNLKYTPRWTFDFQNGSIAQGYLEQAGISTLNYPKKFPSQLNGCDDLFVMPHADPTWAEHKQLFYWNKDSRGWFWYGCHAGSVVENLVNPNNPAEKMNFLSNNGLVPDAQHGNGTPPYVYAHPTEEVMQFMGILDGAAQNGAEQVYLPAGNSGWRPTTKILVHNPTQEDIPTLSTGPAAILGVGRGFGDNTRGKVMMQAGHNYDKGTADAVAGIRAFFNFSFMSIADKDPLPAITGPTNVTAGIPYIFSVSLGNPIVDEVYSYHWTSPCGGKFSNAFGASTTFTPPSTLVCMPCEIMVTVTDGCGREYYETIELSGICPEPPVALDRICKLINNAPGTGPQVIVNQTPLAGTDIDGYVVNYVIKSLPANGTLSYDHDGNAVTLDVNISSLSGGSLTMTATQMKSIKFDPNDGFGGNATFLYTVTDNAALVDLTPATYTIPVNPPPVALTFVCPPMKSNAPMANVCAMQATDDGVIVNYIIKRLPVVEQGVVYLNNVEVELEQVITPAEASQLKFKPSGTFVGYAEITYSATDEDGGFDPTPATLTLQMVNQPPVADDGTAPVILSPVGNIMVGIPALTGTDPDGSIGGFMITVAPQASQGKLYYNNGGVYTLVKDSLNLSNAQAGTLKFDAADNFSGLATFKFTVFDNAGLVDSSSAFYQVPVKQTPPIADDENNPNIYSGAGLTSIDNLDGSDPDSTDIITAYIIKSLMPSSEGVLQYNNGTAYVPVTIGLELTKSQADGLKFDPTYGFIGNTYFTFTVKDDEGMTDPSPATFKIPVTNKKPDAKDVTAADMDDTQGKTTIKKLDGDDDDGVITAFNILSLPDPASGILYLNNTPVTRGQVIPFAQAGILQFDPALGFDGDVKFNYSSTDDLGAVSTRSGRYKIQIHGIIILPIANNITTSALNTKNTQQSIQTFTGSDADGVVASFKISTIPPANQGVLYFQGVAASANQIIPVALANQLTFAPTGTYKGNSTFKYRAVDNRNNESAEATYTIPVVNALPVAPQFTMTDVKKSATVLIPGLKANDADGSIASYTITKLPVRSTLQYDQNGTGVYINVANNTIMTLAQASRLRLVAGAILGLDTFCFKAKDNMNEFGNIANYIIPIAANAINQSPLVNNVTSSSMSYKAGLTSVSPLSGSDNDGTIASYYIESIPPSAFGRLYYNVSGTQYDSIPLGGIEITPLQATTLKFKPSGIYSGNVVIKYSAKDNNDEISASPANLTLTLTNASPSMVNITNAGVPSNNGPALLTPLSGTDDGTIDWYTITSLPNPLHGVLILDGSAIGLGQTIPAMYANRIEFDPNPSYSGNAVFMYSGTDEIGAVDATPATFTIPVTNDVPVADDKISQVITNVNGLGAQAMPELTGTDLDGAITTFIIKSLPAYGKLYVNGTQVVSVPAAGYNVSTANASKITFDPNDGFGGSTSFTYTVEDNNNQVDATPATFQIISNLPPTTANVKASVRYAGGAREAIPALQGNDDGTVAFWSILDLPLPNDGMLYLNNVLVTSLSQVDSLNALQITQLSFQPLGAFDGTVFSYTATDNLGVIDVTPAIYEIPAAPASTLPIKSITFSGTKSGSDNVLKWTTQQEDGLHYFEVEYSLDGANFNSIGNVSAIGTTTRGSDYTLTDRNWVSGTSFYRLKLVDRDGRFSYSNVVTIKRDANSIVIRSIAPNPFMDRVTIDVTLIEAKPVTISLFDMSGKMVKASTTAGVKGQNIITMDNLSVLSSGTYIIEVKGGETRMTGKLVK